MADINTKTQSPRFFNWIWVVVFLIVLIVLMLTLGAWFFFVISVSKQQEVDTNKKVYSLYTEQYNQAKPVYSEILEVLNNAEYAKPKSDNFYNNLLGKIDQRIENSNQLLQTSKDSNTDFSNQVFDATTNMVFSFNEGKKYLKIDKCARDQYFKFSNLETQINAAEKDLGEFVIVLDLTTPKKLNDLSLKYQSLSETVDTSIICFSDLDSLDSVSEEAKKSFAEESNSYKSIAKTLQKQSELTKDVDAFNAAGKERPSSFTVYFKQSIPVWLKDNTELFSKIQQKTEIDENSLKDKLLKKITKNQNV